MSYPTPVATTSGLTFSQLSGLSATLEALITANSAATAVPTAAPTATPTGGGSTGGLLAAGTYLLKFTETNGIGETTASPESTTLTVAAGNIPQVTFPSLKTGNLARNLYATPVNGTTGQEILYATGITTTTFSMSVLSPANSFAVKPPTANTTGFVYTDSNGNVESFVLQNIRAAKVGNLQVVYNNAADLIDTWLHGDPISSSGAIAKLRHAHTAFVIIAKAFSDIGTLMDANPGSLKPTVNGVGNSSLTRTWP